MSILTTVYLIDGDALDRRDLAFRLGSMGIEAWPFSAADTFLLKARDLQPKLVLLDLDSAAARGAELIGALKRAGNDWPIIAMSRGMDVPSAVDSMKLGFIDLLMKPVDEAQLLSAIRIGSTLLARRLQAGAIRAAAEAKVTTLTSRELSVCKGLAAGDPNKVVAYNLGISVRTVEAHRSHIMMKLSVRSVAEVCGLLAQAGKLLSEDSAALGDPYAGSASVRHLGEATAGPARISHDYHRHYQKPRDSADIQAIPRSRQAPEISGAAEAGDRIAQANGRSF